MVRFFLLYYLKMEIDHFERSYCLVAISNSTLTKLCSALDISGSNYKNARKVHSQGEIVSIPKAG